jgi:hypothetical protein
VAALFLFDTFSIFAKIVLCKKRLSKTIGFTFLQTDSGQVAFLRKRSKAN